MKLRSNLLILVVAALLPMLVFAIVAAQLLLRHERQTMEREAIGLSWLIDRRVSR